MDPQYADFYGPAREENETMSPEYMNDWLLRCIELIDKYQPQLFWFDWWIEQPALEPYRKSLASYYYNKGLEWNKGVAINYKNSSFPDGTAVYDIERGSSKAGKKYPWQTDTSIGKKSWGYMIRSLAVNAKAGKVANVELLGSSEKVAWVQKPEGLVIQPSKAWPADCAVGYKISK